MLSPQRILLATDFSAPSRRAAAVAAHLACCAGTALTVVHVIESPAHLTAPSWVPAAPSRQSLEQNLRDRSLRDLQALKDDVLGGVAVTNLIDVTSDSAAERICKIAEEDKSDLIVVGTRGRTGLAHMLVGSVAEKVIRCAHCSVLAVTDPGDGSAFDCRRILVTTDLSEHSERAVAVAAAWAKSTDASLSLLHVVEPLGRMFAGPEGSPVSNARVEILQALKKRAESALEELAKAPRESGIDTQIEIPVNSHPVRCMCVRAGLGDVDMVVVATLGRSGLKRLLMGSVAERMVRHSPRPVLVVR